MEEYEVDLIDYLRVIWKGKWIILGCFALVVGAVTVFTFTRPGEFATEGTYKVAPLPELDSIAMENISKEDAVTILGSRDLVKKVATTQAFTSLQWRDNKVPEYPVEWLDEHMSAENPHGDLIQISITATQPPLVLKEILLQTIALFENEIYDRLISRLDQEESWLESNKQQSISDQDQIEVEVSNKASELEKQYMAQIEGIQRDINAIEEETTQDLLVGEANATLQGYIMREKYSALTSRLRPLQEQLDKLRLDERTFFPQLFDRLDQLETKITGINEKIAGLDRLQDETSQGEYMLVTFENPYEVMNPIGPNKKLNIAVAAVLSLFVGVLVAFFVHYLGSTREEERKIRQGSIELSS